MCVQLQLKSSVRAKHDMCVCSQEDTFVPTMTCRETLAFYGGVTLGGPDWGRAQRNERVEEVLAAVGLAHASHTLVSMLCSQ